MTSSDAERSALRQRLDHVRVDLDELAAQIDAGEIDAATGKRLGARYEAELAELKSSLEMPGREDAAPSPDEKPRSYRRAVIGTLALLASFTLAIVFISGDSIPTQQGAAEGIDPTPRAAPQTQGMFDAMEQAVVADPGNISLRLGLADAYFQQGEYSTSLSHYLAVLERNPDARQESIALGRVGWMAFITSQFDAADEYLRRSLDADPGNVEGKLFLGYVRLLGFDDPAEAIPLLEDVLDFPDLSTELRAEVEGMLESARSRETTP